MHHRGVGRGSRVWLNVGELCTKERLGALDSQLFGDVYLFASAVVPAAGVSLGVLVSQDGSLRLQDRHRNEVLRGDHLEEALLTREFAIEHLSNLGVNLRKGGVEVWIDHERSP